MKTKEVWQPFSSEPLSVEDAEEIVDNIIRLLEFLTELDKKYGSGNSS